MRGTRWWYTALAVALVAFGIVGILSIGAPFLLTGLVMLALTRWRDRPYVIWPPLAGVWALVLGYVLVAPLSCSSTAPAATTICTGLFIRYHGGAVYNPSLVPALLTGIVVGLAAGSGVWLLLRSRASRRSRHAARAEVESRH
jgi:hypothetical protein